MQCDVGLSGLVAMDLDLTAAKIWEHLRRGWGFGRCLKENRAGRCSEINGF